MSDKLKKKFRQFEKQSLRILKKRKHEIIKLNDCTFGARSFGILEYEYSEKSVIVFFLLEPIQFSE